jgi:hypothetical protein
MARQVDAKTFMLAVAAAAKSGKTMIDVAAALGMQFNTANVRWNAMREELVADFKAAGRNPALIPTIPTGKKRGRPTADDKFGLACDLFGGDALNEIDVSDVIPTAPESAYDAAEQTEQTPVS